MTYNAPHSIINDNLFKNLKNFKSVVLFGTGNLGKIALKSIEKTGIKIEAIADNDKSKWGKKWNNYKVISPIDFKNLNKDTCIIVASLRFIYMKKQCQTENNNIQVFDFDFLLKNIDLAECETEWSVDRCKEELDLYVYSLNAQLEKEKLHLNSIDLVLTEKCSLKCKDCSNLMQYYAKPIDEDFDLLMKSIERLLSTVGYIREIRIIGGEPLLYKKIDLVVKKLLTYNNYDKIFIYTNGTIVFKDEKMRVFQNDKILFKISNYGSISRNVEKLETSLTNLGVQFITERVKTWQDCAKIEKYERNEDLTKFIFGNCCENQGLTLLHGKLYTCPFSANATNLGAIPQKEKDIFEIHKDNSQNLKEGIKEFYFEKEYTSACNFCNGRDYNVGKVEAAVQTKNPMAFKKFTN